MRRFSGLFAAIFVSIVPALAVAQEPAPPTPPEPPRAEDPSPRAPRPPQPPRASRAPRAARAATLHSFLELDQVVDFPKMVQDAARSTGIPAEQVAPAVEAFRATFAPDADSFHLGDLRIARRKVGRDGHAMSVIRRTPVDDEERARIASAEKRLHEAIQELPAGKREAFADWASTTRRQLETFAAALIGDPAAEAEAAGRSDAEARAALEALLAAERDLEAARRHLGEKDMTALAEAHRALDAQSTNLAEQLARLSRARIETSLDKNLFDRYRNLATAFDRDATRRTVEDLLRSERNLFQRSETAPEAGGGDLERRIAELRAQREGIDRALEEATTALVRERAQRLHEEALQRQAQEVLQDALKRPHREKAASGAEPRLPQPARQRARDATPEPSAAEPGAPRASESYEPEIRRLREELKALRQEVEALRRKNEPK
jgi:hypothetical protein